MFIGGVRQYQADPQLDAGRILLCTRFMSAPKKNVVGAWLLHHDQKLLNSKTTAFENIALAGRAARLLSVISKEEGWTVPTERITELARGIGIRKLELPGLLGELES